MAEVDRLLKKLPKAEPTLGGGGQPTVRRPAVAGGPVAVAASALRSSGGGWLATWVKVVLGVLVAVGVTPGVWQYSHGCGLRLIFYLVGVATVVATGLLASVASWRRRMGLADVVSQTRIVWGGRPLSP